MNSRSSKIFLASMAAGRFVGRKAELDDIRKIASAGTSAVLLAEPGSGSTELLLQVFDGLFDDPSGPAPFYFSFADNFESVGDLARRFVGEMLTQVAAFARREKRLVRSALTARELRTKAVETHQSIFRGIERYYGSIAKYESETAFLHKAFAAPARAASAGVKMFLMLDHIDRLDRVSTETVSILLERLGNPAISGVAAGRRRRLYGMSDLRQMPFERLTFSLAAQAAGEIASLKNVAVNDRTLDLITLQLDRDLALIDLFFASASERGLTLTTFADVQEHYISEIFGGRVSRHFDSILECPGSEPTEPSVKHLFTSLHGRGSKSAAAMREAVAGLPDRLNNEEVVRISSGRVEPVKEAIAFNDYLKTRHRLETSGERRALAFGRALLADIRRGPQMMASHYRRSSLLGVRELVSRLNGRSVPAALLDHSIFAPEFSGAPEAEILSELRKASETIDLPKIAFTAQTAAIYEPLGNVTEPERSAVGFGFSSGQDNGEVYWLAAEIESKLPAAADHTEFWLDRLEMAAAMCDLTPNKVWLIAPEGFSPEAHEVLRRRSAIGSSRKQAELLLKYLQGERVPASQNAEEYEITIPMDDNAELIAANIVEDIARRRDLDSRSVNQIKTALIEAIINATEHSHSPDRKVHQKFTVDDTRFSVSVSNRGVRLQDVKPAEAASKRRGWGLELMRRLMDEVKIEETDDGTRISMTKFLKPA